MPVVFVVAEDWKLRAGLRAELRERGIEAMGMESAADVGAALAASEMPASIVLDAESKPAGNPAIQQLIAGIPSVLIASRMQSTPLPRATKVFYRPVRLAEIVAAVIDLLQRQRV